MASASRIGATPTSPGGIAMSSPLRVVHYLNQFFGGIGGEDQAQRRRDGEGRRRRPRPPAREGARRRRARRGHHHLRRQLRQRARARTPRARSPAELDRLRPDVLVAGPAFGSGRYGLACALACKVAQEPGRRRDHRDAPGESGRVSGRARGIYIVPTGASTTSMPAALDALAPLARRLGRGERLGPAEVEGYIPAGHAPRPRPRAPGLSARARHAARQAPRPALPVGGAVRRAGARAPGAADRRSLARAHRDGHDRRPRAQGQPRPAGVGERRALSPAHGGRARVALARASGRPTTRATSTTSSTATRTTSCRCPSCATSSVRGGSARSTSTSTRCPA